VQGVPEKHLQHLKPWGRKFETGTGGAVRPAPPPEETRISDEPVAADPFEKVLPPFLQDNEAMREGFLKVAALVKKKRREGLAPTEALEAAKKMAARFPELEAARQGRRVARIPKAFSAGMEIALQHYKAFADGEA